MPAILCQPSSIDRMGRAHLIRETFAQSDLFREAAVSDPLPGPDGEVTLDVSFDGGPTIFRVVANSEERAYAALLELARAMVEIDQAHRVPC